MYIYIYEYIENDVKMRKLHGINCIHFSILYAITILYYVYYVCIYIGS